MSATNWATALMPLIEKYKDHKHPLEYKNLYQLMVMVVLSAQTTDKLINQVAPALFKAFPDMESLARADEETLFSYISKVRNFGHKGQWLIEIANKIKEDRNIPTALDELTALPGIGRKSANVIMREAGAKAEGIGVDLHVVRVAQRIGVVNSDDPKKIEKQLMEVMPQNTWNQVGMSLSFLGREICRPTDPDCPNCIMNKYCEYFLSGKREMVNG